MFMITLNITSHMVYVSIIFTVTLKTVHHLFINFVLFFAYFNTFLTYSIVNRKIVQLYTFDYIFAFIKTYLIEI